MKINFSNPVLKKIDKNLLFQTVNQSWISSQGEIVKKLLPSESGNIELDVPLIKNDSKNKNDLIFFILLFTYVLIFYIYRDKYEK